MIYKFQEFSFHKPHLILFSSPVAINVTKKGEDNHFLEYGSIEKDLEFEKCFTVQ